MSTPAPSTSTSTALASSTNHTSTSSSSSNNNNNDDNMASIAASTSSTTNPSSTSTNPGATTATSSSTNPGAANANAGPFPDFALNEKVLCYHGPLVYEAKILKVQNMGDEPSQITGLPGMHYFVHYKGWKQTWDEWVAAHRLLKHTDTNIALQKELQEKTKRDGATASHAAGGGAHGAAPNAGTGGAALAHPSGKAKGAGTGRGRGGGGGTKGTSGDASSAGGAGGAGGGGGTAPNVHLGVAPHGASRGTKRPRDADGPDDRRPEMKLVVPELLKSRLVDDWENVTKNAMVVEVPKSPSARDVLREFGEWVGRERPAGLRDPAELAPTVIAGLECYFDKALGTHLLYRFERKQYADIRKRYFTGQHVKVGLDEKEMSEIYGAEHLLRMLVSLPQMVAQSALDNESVQIIGGYVNELLQYMLRERDRIFSKEYKIMGIGYQNVARS